MASDIQVSSLTATPGVGQITLTATAVPPAGMECLAYMQPAKIEFWSSATNNRGSATKVGESATGLVTIDGLPDGASRYSWARAIDGDGNLGPYYPVSATAGVLAVTKVIVTTPPDGSITTVKLADGAVTKAKFEVGTTPVEIVSSLPTTGNYAGRMVFLTSDGKLYRHTGSPAGSAGFTVAVAAPDITGTIISTQISDGAISTPKLAANSVTAAKIGAGEVIAGKLAADSVTANAIVAGAVSAAKMSVSQLSAITANLGTVTAGTINGLAINAGTITGSRFQTKASGARLWVDEANNALLVIDSAGNARAGIGGSGLASGVFVGYSNYDTVTAEATLTSGNAVALRARNSGSGGGHAVLGVSSAGGGYGVNAVTGKVYSAGGYLPFTGMHECLVRRGAELELGDIVYVKRVLHRDGLDNILTEVARTDLVGDRRVIGIVSEIKDIPRGSPLAALGCDQSAEVTKRRRRYLYKTFQHVTVNALGEGQMDVCGRGGDIGAGDYIITSDLPGKGQRLDMDQPVTFALEAAIVAQAMEPVAFDSPDQVKRVAVFYRCG